MSQVIGYPQGNALLSGTNESAAPLPVGFNRLPEFGTVGKDSVPVMAAMGPGGGNRLLAGNLPADMAQLANVVVSDGLLQSWAANGIDYVATYSDGKVATVTASDGWVQTYTWVGDVPTITVEQA